jgi:hypothetical protein
MGLFATGSSAIGPFAEALAWLWRLSLRHEPAAELVGLGTLEEAPALHRLVRSGELRGAAIFATRPGPDDGPVPGRARLNGVARFDSGISTQGAFTTLQGPGQEVVRSSFGAHALRDGNWMTLGSDPIGTWGTLKDFWAVGALREFLADVLDHPPVCLPAVGLLRYDDVPGTASQQLKGEDKPDRKVERRVRRLASLCADAGATLNVAVTARALAGGREVPLDQVWPRSIAALAEGIAEGSFEQISHGYLHLAPGSGEDHVEPREFAGLDRAEARRRIDAALEWAEEALGARPRTFVAPNWAYGQGTLGALAELGLPAFLPCVPGPLLEGPNVRESLVSTLDGLHGLDYGPLAALAQHGVPPYVAIHGGLIDSRFNGLRLPRDAASLARLAIRRDLVRLPGVPGLRWVGAGELVELLTAHDGVKVSAERAEMS